VNELSSRTANELINNYESTLRRLADYYAPATTRLRRTRRLSVWFDEDCRHSRRCTHLLERRYKKSKLDADSQTWIIQVNDMHSLYLQKENLHWNACIASNAGNPSRMWRSVSSILKKAKNSSSTQPSLKADKL